MDILWYVPNILTNILDFFIYIKFIELFLPPKVLPSKINWHPEIIFTLLICGINIIGFFVDINSFSFCIFYFVYLLFSFFAYSGNLIKKLFLTLAEPVIIGLLSVPIHFLLYQFIGNPYKSQQLDLMYSTLRTFISLIILYVIISFIKMRRQKKLQTNENNPYLALVLFIMSLGLTFLLCIVKYYRNSNFSKSSFENLIAIIFICILLMVLSLITLYSHSINHLQHEYELKLQVQFNEIQEDYYEKITASTETLRSLRHDLKNHLIALDGYLAREKISQARSYLQDIIQTTIDANSIVNLENIMLSSVLTQKKMVCTEKQIAFHFNVSMGPHTISDTDLCILIGNILDNAVEASQQVPDEKGYIDLDISDANEVLSIHCCNNYIRTPVMQNGRLLSTKSNRIMHGIGMQNIANMVSKYDGTLNYHYANQVFTMEILLKY